MDLVTTVAPPRFLRRRVYLTAAGFTVLLLVALFGLNWFFYRQTHARFQADLEDRLVSLGQMTRLLTEREYAHDAEKWKPRPQPGAPDARLAAALQPILAQVRQVNYLENVFVFNRARQSLADARPDWKPGREYTFFQLDPTAVDRAWNGQPVLSRQYDVENLHFSACYVPLDLGGTPAPDAICCLQASVEYLGVLDWLSQTLVIASLLGIAIIVFFGILVAVTFRSLDAAAQAVGQSERLAIMGQMAAKVAHEIRNPLGIIKGTAEVLRERAQKAGHPEEMFDFILEEVQRLDAIAENFLQLSREVPLRKQPLAIGDVLERLCSSLETSVDPARVRITRRIAPECPLVLADRSKLQQVFLNLLLNSVEAIQDKGEITVETRYTLATGPGGTGEVVVEITDTGVGIAPGQLTAVLQPFVTTKKEGTGLGLPIAKRLIEQHGGTLTLTSTEGSGTTVTIRLPAAGRET